MTLKANRWPLVPCTDSRKWKHCTSMHRGLVQCAIYLQISHASYFGTIPTIGLFWCTIYCREIWMEGVSANIALYCEKFSSVQQAYLNWYIGQLALVRTLILSTVAITRLSQICHMRCTFVALWVMTLIKWQVSHSTCVSNTLIFSDRENTFKGNSVKAQCHLLWEFPTKPGQCKFRTRSSFIWSSQRRISALISYIIVHQGRLISQWSHFRTIQIVAGICGVWVQKLETNCNTSWIHRREGVSSGRSREILCHIYYSVSVCGEYHDFVILRFHAYKSSLYKSPITATSISIMHIYGWTSRSVMKINTKMSKISTLSGATRMKHHRQWNGVELCISIERYCYNHAKNRPHKAHHISSKFRPQFGNFVDAAER